MIQKKVFRILCTSDLEIEAENLCLYIVADNTGEASDHFRTTESFTVYVLEFSTGFYNKQTSNNKMPRFYVYKLNMQN